VDTTSASASTLLSNAAWFVVQLFLLVVGIVFSPRSADVGNLDVTAVVRFVLAVIFAVGVASAVVLGIPRFRRAAMPPLRRGAAVIWDALRSPRRATLLVAGNALGTVLAAWSMQACLLAFGAHLSFWSILAAHTGVNTIASFVPIPGGGAAVGAIGMSGVLIAFGVDDSVAVAAVLASQVVGKYLTAVPGWLATRHLVNRGEL
jgi:uncharacterized membrane protein YbhN (UPF0104 family)